MKGLTVDQVQIYRDKNELSIDRFVNKPEPSPSEIIHLHYCRPGPLLANDIFLSIREKQKNPSLQKIIGLIPPFGTCTKYLVYWFGGLDSETIKEITDNLILNGKNFITDIYHSRESVIFNLAEEVKIPWNAAVKSLFGPIYRNYRKEFFNIEGCSLYNELLALHHNKITNSDDCLTELSSYVINRYLKYANLPLVEFRKVATLLKRKYVKKTVNKQFWQEITVDLKSKRFRCEQTAVNEIINRFKGYTRRPKYKEFIQTLKNLSKKRSRSCRKVLFNRSLLYLYLIGDAEIYKTLHQEILDILVDNYHSLQLALDVNTKDCINTLPFIRGEDMLEICFKIAHETNTQLVLQKFFRPGGYEKYAEMLKKYPKLHTNKSSFDIWKVDEFPEYEMNFVFALKYIKEYLETNQKNYEEQK